MGFDENGTQGMDDASKLGYDLCEAIYAATRVGQGGVHSNDTKKCEVKPNTVAKLIGALRWVKMVAMG